MAALLLLPAWALLTDGGARPEPRPAVRAAGPTSVPALPVAALRPGPGRGLPALSAPPPPLSPASPTRLPPAPTPFPPAAARPAPPPGTLPPHRVPSPPVPTRHPDVPVAETGATAREAEDHSSALVPIALGLALTGAAVYKHRGLPGGH